MAKRLNRAGEIELRWSLAEGDFRWRGPESTLVATGADFVAGSQPETLGIAFEAIAPAGVVSSPFGPPTIRTTSCWFDARQVSEGPATVAAATTVAGICAPGLRMPVSQRPATVAGRYTRVQPPRDLVKLEDRLRLLLEPPLETLFAARSLRFAHEPFAYQLDGIAFLYPRHEAVLADEMGLGKTMQAVTAIRLLAHQGELRRVLLVCPKPLVNNWRREFATWAPELPVTVIEGGAARRQWLWRATAGRTSVCEDDPSGDGPQRRLKNVVTIANYEALVRDRDEVCDPRNQYDLVVLDESQRIKNISGATGQVVRSLARRRSWALTGTPLENSIEDLVGIFEFVSPGQVNAKMKPRAIGRAVADHVLRRTKDQVLPDLPPKLFRDAELELSPEQAASYKLAEDEGVVRLREMKQELTITHVFELVLRLKQICNFDPATGASSKLERLEADLEECAASGRKAIVFSQWVETLFELRRRLARFGPVEYHGQVPSHRREEAIEYFRNEPACRVMLMTYGAGSVGLNLQFASYVFLFDRWWNPAVEDQAINRAHRIGVERAVTVTRFLALNTIEQRIQDVLDRKRELFDAVFKDSISGPAGGLSREEVFSLFQLRPQAEANGEAA